MFVSKLSQNVLTRTLQTIALVAVGSPKEAIGGTPAATSIAAISIVRCVRTTVFTTLSRKRSILLRGDLDVRHQRLLLELLIRRPELVAVSLQRLAALFELCEGAGESVDLLIGTLKRILQLADLISGGTLHSAQLLVLGVQLLLQALVGVLLIVDLLGALVSPKCHTAVGALHDDCRAKSAEHTHLVVVSRAEDRHRHVVGFVKRGSACWAGSDGALS